MDSLTWLRAQWDRVTGFVTIGLGLIALVFGYLGVSGAKYLNDGLSYVVSGGIGGLFLLGVGTTLLLTAEMRDEWRKLDRIAELLATQGDTGAVEHPLGVDGTTANSIVPEVTEAKAPRRKREARPAGSLRAARTSNNVGQASGQQQSVRGLPTGSQLFVGGGLSIPRELPLLTLGLEQVLLGTAAALGVLAVAWSQAATTARPASAIYAAALAVAALVVLGGAAGFLLSNSRRAIKRCRRAVLAPLIARLGEEPSPELTRNTLGLDGWLVAATNGEASLHRRGCPLISVSGRPADGSEIRMLPACGLCTGRG